MDDMFYFNGHFVQDKFYLIVRLNCNHSRHFFATLGISLFDIIWCTFSPISFLDSRKI